MKVSVCRTCGKPISEGRGGYEVLGWHDPEVVDDLNDGRTCDVTGSEHIPGDVQ